MKIAIAGTGYVGLVTGICLASKGHQVICADVDKEKIEKMQQGISPIYEPGLSELMSQNMENLVFTTDFSVAYKNPDVIFIGVGTPEKSDGSANLSYVFQAAGQIADFLEQDCVIVIKSTVPIGTNDKVENFLVKRLRHKVKIYVVSNPEFLSQGTAVYDTLHSSRIVIGVTEPYPGEVLKEVYKNFDCPKLVMERRSAEMVKYASNDYLALKISYVNEIANLCETVGADIEEVTSGMGLDPRIGSYFLKAGIGYGGSCFPKDTKALNWLANYNDQEFRTIRAAIEVNEIQKYTLIKKAKKYYESFWGLNVAVLGCSFKPGTDDLREAPSLVNIPVLIEDGANVRVWDPVGKENMKKRFPDIRYCDNLDETLLNTDLCLILTEWPAIKNYDVRNYKKLMRHPIVLDGRNCYNLKVFEGTDIIYDSIGRKRMNM